MILRANVLALFMALLFYGLFWIATFTPFFKDKERVRGIAKRFALMFIAGITTVLVMGFLIAVDHTI
jgi:hypothetical protein